MVTLIGFCGNEAHRNYSMNKTRFKVRTRNNNSRLDVPLSKMSYISRPLNFEIAGSKVPNYTESFPRTNECKIIFVNKQQRAYVESLEVHIK